MGKYVVFLGLLAAAACGSDDPVLDTPEECNPLGGMNCITPWPSSIYEVDDPATATGPIITTTTDLVGTFIYFLLGMIFLI